MSPYNSPGKVQAKKQIIEDLNILNIVNAKEVHPDREGSSNEKFQKIADSYKRVIKYLEKENGISDERSFAQKPKVF